MRETIKSYVLLALGNMLLAISVVFFFIPNKVLSGGVAGVAIALYPFFKIEVEVMINIIIVLTFILGSIFLGKNFALKTIASSIMYPIFITLLNQIPYQPTLDPMIAALYGGALSGLGLGITFSTGASTGGMDVPPLILNKFTGIRVSIWVMIVDALTIMLGMASYSVNEVLIGFLSIFAASYVIDKVSVLGGQQARQVTIISELYNEILDHLHEEIDRGSTLYRARGGYTRKDKEIIMTVVTRQQYYELEKKVLEIDSEAFLIVSNVMEVHGQGFRKK
jgi:uncharacterized membrane-anchored protein YitT (DUF2179 family)